MVCWFDCHPAPPHQKYYDVCLSTILIQNQFGLHLFLRFFHNRFNIGDDSRVGLAVALAQMVGRINHHSYNALGATSAASHHLAWFL